MVCLYRSMSRCGWGSYWCEALNIAPHRTSLWSAPPSIESLVSLPASGPTMGEKVLTKPCVLLAQVIFYAWGFYALGEDDTLEVKLTGQPARPPLEVGHAAAVSPSSASLGVQSGEESTASEDSAMEGTVTYVGMVPDDARLENVLMASSATGLQVCDGHVRGGSGGEQVPGAQHVAVGEEGNAERSLSQCDIVVLPSQPADELQRWQSRVSGHGKNKSKQQLTATGESNLTSEGANDSLRGADARATVWQRVSIILTSANIIAVVAGVVIAMIGPLQDILFNDPQAVLHPLGAALEVRWRRCHVILVCVHIGQVTI